MCKIFPLNVFFALFEGFKCVNISRMRIYCNKNDIIHVQNIPIKYIFCSVNLFRATTVYVLNWCFMNWGVTYRIDRTMIDYADITYNIITKSNVFYWLIGLIALIYLCALYRYARNVQSQTYMFVSLVRRREDPFTYYPH